MRIANFVIYAIRIGLRAIQVLPSCNVSRPVLHRVSLWSPGRRLSHECLRSTDCESRTEDVLGMAAVTVAIDDGAIFGIWAPTQAYAA